jgi:hypothetical protein
MARNLKSSMCEKRKRHHLQAPNKRESKNKNKITLHVNAQLGECARCARAGDLPVPREVGGTNGAYCYTL